MKCHAEGCEGRAFARLVHCEHTCSLRVDLCADHVEGVDGQDCPVCKRDDWRPVFERRSHMVGSHTCPVVLMPCREPGWKEPGWRRVKFEDVQVGDLIRCAPAGTVGGNDTGDDRRIVRVWEREGRVRHMYGPNGRGWRRVEFLPRRGEWRTTWLQRGVEIGPTSLIMRAVAS